MLAVTRRQRMVRRRRGEIFRRKAINRVAIEAATRHGIQFASVTGVDVLVVQAAFCCTFGVHVHIGRYGVPKHERMF